MRKSANRTVQIFCNPVFCFYSDFLRQAAVSLYQRSIQAQIHHNSFHIGNRCFKYFMNGSNIRFKYTYCISQGLFPDFQIKLFDLRKNYPLEERFCRICVVSCSVRANPNASLIPGKDQPRYRQTGRTDLR